MVTNDKQRSPKLWRISYADPTNNWINSFVWVVALTIDEALERWREWIVERDPGADVGEPWRITYVAGPDVDLNELLVASGITEPSQSSPAPTASEPPPAAQAKRR